MSELLSGKLDVTCVGLESGCSLAAGEWVKLVGLLDQSRKSELREGC